MYFGKSDASERALEIVPARDEQVHPGESERESEKEKDRTAEGGTERVCLTFKA